MRKPPLGMGLVLIALVALTAAPALVQGRGHGGGKRHREARVEFRERHFDRERELERDEDHDFDRDDRVIMCSSPSIFFLDFFGTRHPPGWDRGRKVGWGNCDVPPGLAKKFGCRGVVFRGDRRPRRGSVIVIPVL